MIERSVLIAEINIWLLLGTSRALGLVFSAISFGLFRKVSGRMEVNEEAP